MRSKNKTGPGPAIDERDDKRRYNKGRPRFPQGRARSTQIAIRVTPVEAEILERARKKNRSQSIGEYMRQVGLDHSRNVLIEK